MFPWLTKVALTTATTTTLAAGSVAIERGRHGMSEEDTPVSKVSSVIVAGVRFTRSVYTASHIIIDYHRLFGRHQDYECDEYRKERSEVHARSAERLLKLARIQGGVYVKLGQHVSSMVQVVPREYTSRLKLLEDRASHRPFREIEKHLRREYGIQKLSDKFIEFDEKPIAAASLAQVHRAKLLCKDSKAGSENVAVKVQYPGLEPLIRSDLSTIRLLSRFLRYNFPFFNMDWAVTQFRRNLDQELDFLHELQNAQRTSAMFAKDDRIKVPTMFENVCTKRILVMEYIDGCRIDDKRKITDEGINADTVAKTVIEAFAKMIFIDGFVHCDPHAGNILVRKAGTNVGFEVCLLDHGLYRELDDDFRRGYCQLWKGLILRRDSDLSEGCKKLGVPGLEDLLSMMALNRPWKSARQFGTDVRLRMSREEMEQFRKDMKRKGMKGEDIVEMMSKLPEDLILVFKMNSLIRNVNKSLGARMNRLKVNARFAVNGLRKFNEDKFPSGRRRRRANGDGDASAEVVVASTGEQEHSKGLIMIGVDWMSRFKNGTVMIVDRLAVEVQLLILELGCKVMSWWTWYHTKESGLQGTPVNDLEQMNMG